MKAIQKLSALVQERGLEGDYSDLGAIYTKVSPEKDLILFNYSPLAMIQNTWNEYERIARGLVMDAQGNVIALPFPKFFNLDQMPETSTERVKAVGVRSVTEKMDGSLGILYFWRGQWRIITRGSFESEQSSKAYELLRKYDLSYLLENATYLLEIVYPENRIVLDYGKKEFLCLLAIMDNADETEYSYNTVKHVARNAGFNLPEGFLITDLDKVLEMRERVTGVEGWVLVLNDGTRVKVKTEEYLTLHRAISHITPKNLFEVYRVNRDVDSIASGYPDEFKDDVLAILNKFEERFYQILHKTSDYYLSICHLLAAGRKEFALAARDFEWPNLLFVALDRRDMARAILDIMWKEM